MVSVNLLPAEIVQKQATGRRARGWALTFLLALGAAALPVSMSLTHRAQAASLAFRSKRVQESRETLQKELTQAARHADAMDQHLARSEALRAKRSWSGLVTFIVGSMPEEVCLTALSTKQQAANTGPRRGGAAERARTTPGGRVILEAPTCLRIQGYAEDHEHLYSFMARLKREGVFSEVKLLGAVLEPVLATQAVRFELQCGW